ncbi:uncharacterized protein [Leptinotarsa decemlineata]|uniref:uncharacterized protein n=1 Tax=Leptinotarsa decemlineata TaxID=7539 RepID=UPI003D306A23
MIKESGAWLNALPVASLGTLLDDESFRIAVGLRMGSSICVSHTCVCGSIVDEKGTHGLSCRRSAGRISRHHQVNDILKRAMLSADVPAILEPLGTSRDIGKRPNDMSLIPWKYGKPVVWDFICVDTVAASHLAESSKSAGTAALSGEKLKRKKYQNLGNNYLFHPVAVETFGVYGPESLLFVHELGRRIGQATKDYRSTSFLIERISIAIQRGNAASVLGTIPPSHNFDEIMHCPNFSTELKPLRNKPRYVDIYQSPIKGNSQVIDPPSSFSVRSVDSGHSWPQKMSCIPRRTGTISVEALLEARAESIPLRNPFSLERIDRSLRNCSYGDSVKRVLPYESVESCPENLEKKIGLDNLGNTCYMNSILQVLFMTKNFKNEVLMMNENGNVSCLFIKLKQLFMQLQFRKKVSSFPLTDFLESEVH